MTGPSASPDPELRADARRNRAKILAAARGQITRLGADVPMDVIADAAGVAVGTLYRHYPTKTDLVAAVVTEHSERITCDLEAAADRVTIDAEAMVQIRSLVTHILDEAAADGAVKAAAQRFGAAPFNSDQEARSRRAMSRLIARAQAAGHLRADLSADDLYLLIITAPTDLEAGRRERWLELFFEGFRLRP